MILRMLGLANAWCRKLEEEEMKEEKERRKRKRTKKRMKRMKRRTKRTKRTKRTNKRKRRGGEGRGGRGGGRGGEGGGGGGGESVENLVRGDSFKAKAEAKPKQSKIHKTRRQAGGFELEQSHLLWFRTLWILVNLQVWRVLVAAGAWCYERRSWTSRFCGKRMRLCRGAFFKASQPRRHQWADCALATNCGKAINYPTG